MMFGNEGSKRRYCPFTPPVISDAEADILANLPVEINQVRIDGFTGTLPRRFNVVKTSEKEVSNFSSFTDSTVPILPLRLQSFC